MLALVAGFSLLCSCPNSFSHVYHSEQFHQVIGLRKLVANGFLRRLAPLTSTLRAMRRLYFLALGNCLTRCMPPSRPSHCPCQTSVLAFDPNQSSSPLHMAQTHAAAAKPLGVSLGVGTGKDGRWGWGRKNGPKNNILQDTYPLFEFSPSTTIPLGGDDVLASIQQVARVWRCEVQHL